MNPFSTFLQYFAEKFETDVKTILVSIFNGSVSTAVGIEMSNYPLLQITWDFQFEKHIIGVFWAAITCIIITSLSFCINKTLKEIDKRIERKRSKK